MTSVLYLVDEIKVSFDMLHPICFIPNANGFIVLISLCPSRSRLEMIYYDQIYFKWLKVIYYKLHVVSSKT